MFDLQRDAMLDDKKVDFALNLSQQGDRLKHYREKPNLWTAARFSLALIDLQSGEIMATSSAGEKFSVSLILDDKPILHAGKYMIVVIPVWNESSQLDTDYKKVMLEVLCPTDDQNDAMLSEIDPRTGLELFTMALKGMA